MLKCEANCNVIKRCWSVEVVGPHVIWEQLQQLFEARKKVVARSHLRIGHAASSTAMEHIVEWIEFGRMECAQIFYSNQRITKRSTQTSN